MGMRKIFGLIALLAIALAGNILAWTQNIFALSVLVPTGVAVVAGLLWLVRVFVEGRGGASLEGRAMGGINAVVSSTVFLGICIVLYAFAQSLDLSWDLTEEGRRELSPLTIQVLQTMTTEVNVKALFLSIDDELVNIAREKTIRFLDECQKYTDLVKVEVLDPQIDRMRLAEMNITHASMQGTVIIRAGTRQRVITLSGGSPRLEERDFTNAIINVLRNSEPKVYFLTGHEERQIDDETPNKGTSALANLLRGESYQTAKLSIAIQDPVVPADCDVLVIHDPRKDLHPQEIRGIQDYMERGGRLFILFEPWASVSAGSSNREYLRPWLAERYGVLVGSDVVVTGAPEAPWMIALDAQNEPFIDEESGFMEYNGSYLIAHPITAKFDQKMLLQTARSVTPSEALRKGIKVSTLLRTEPRTWGETDTLALFQAGESSYESDELQGPVSIATAVTTKMSTAGDGEEKEGRMVVLGDAELAVNSYLNDSVGGQLTFVLSTFAWLTESEDMIAIRPSGTQEPPLLLSPFHERAITWLSTLLTLQAVAASGLLLYLVRRKNQ
jgi:hypothetical protein